MPSPSEIGSVFLANRHGLMAYISATVPESHTAEDIFQEVWVRLAAASEKGAPIEDQAKWCRGVARNLILHHWRSQRNAKVVVDSLLVERIDLAFAEQDEPNDASVARWQALRECIKALPAKSKDLLRLRYDDGLKIDAIASTLSCSVDAVFKAISRVRQALGQCVRRKLELGEHSA